MMVVVEILALALAAITWIVRDINQGLHEFYQPGGRLEQIHKGMGEGPDARAIRETDNEGSSRAYLFGPTVEETQGRSHVVGSSVRSSATD
jgi:hypothetical protein